MIYKINPYSDFPISTFSIQRFRVTAVEISGFHSCKLTLWEKTKKRLKGTGPNIPGTQTGFWENFLQKFVGLIFLKTLRPLFSKNKSSPPFFSKKAPSSLFHSLPKTACHKVYEKHLMVGTIDRGWAQTIFTVLV